MNEKIEYVRYLHQFLIEKRDRRNETVREWLYKFSNDDEVIMRLDVDRTYEVYSEPYSDLLGFNQWIRNCKIDKLLNQEGF